MDEVLSELRGLSDIDLDVAMSARLPVEADDATFLVAVSRRNLAGLEFGRRQGWWADYTVDGPVAPRLKIKAADFVGKTMAHVMAEIGFFPSVGQARKNGWDKPVEPGVFKVGKTKIVEVV